MTLTIVDFIEQVEGLTVDDVPPEVRERINGALADLDANSGGSSVDNPNSILVSESGNGDFSSIQAAIDSVGADSTPTIFVESGTYREEVTVDTSVALQALSGSERPTVESPDGIGSTIEVSADGVTIAGFEINNRLGNNSGFSYNQCITAGAVSNLNIRDNVFRNIGTDVDARGNSEAITIQPTDGSEASDINVTNNTFEQIRGDFNPDVGFPNRVPKAIYVSTNPGANDTVGASGTARSLEIKDNVIHDIAGPVSAHGIQLHYRVQNVDIEDNLIYDIRGDPDNSVTEFSFGGGDGDLSYDFASAIQLSKGSGSVGGPLEDVTISSNYISADSSPADLSGVSDPERDDSATPGFALEVSGFTDPDTVELRDNAIEADGGIINKASDGSVTAAGTTIDGGAVDAVENWWGDASGPSSDDQDPNAPYQSAGGSATADGSGSLVVDYNEDGVSEVDFDNFLESQPISDP